MRTSKDKSTKTISTTVSREHYDFVISEGLIFSKLIKQRINEKMAELRYVKEFDALEINQ